MHSIKINIKEKDIEKEMDNLAKDWKKEVMISGFRKGKAPVEIIKSRLSDKLHRESLQRLIQEQIVSATDKYEPFIYSPPELQNLNESDENIEFEALVDVPPDIDIDFCKIKLDKEDVIKEVDINSELKRLQEINSELRSVNKPIKKGDVVFIDIKANDESISNYSFTVNDDSFSKKIKGLKAGDEKELETEFPQDIPIETLSGKKEKATIKIVEVKKKILPELNDEFAKDLGFNNLEELKSHLKEGINKEAQENQKEKIMNKVLQKALDLAKDIEVSPTLIEIQKREGLSEEEAIKRAKELTLIDAIAVKEGFTIEENELDEWLEKISESTDDELEEMGEEAIRFVKLHILRNKSLDFLLEKAKEGVSHA